MFREQAPVARERAIIQGHNIIEMEDNQTTRSIQEVTADTPDSNSVALPPLALTEGSSSSPPPSISEANPLIAKIDSIIASLHIVDYKIDRLPSRLLHEYVKYVSYRWLNRTFPGKLFNSTNSSDFKLKLENFRYETLGLVETMTKMLLQLDGVESYGMDSVRNHRREQVKKLHERINRVEENVSKINKLLDRCRTPTPSTADAVSANSNPEITPTSAIDGELQNTTVPVDNVEESSDNVEESSSTTANIIDDESSQPIREEKQENFVSDEEGNDTLIWRPESSLVQSNGKIIYLVNIPGVNPSDITIDLDTTKERGLVVKGFRRPQVTRREVYEQIYWGRGPRHGKPTPIQKFNCRVLLPECVNLQSLQANLGVDGVLRIEFDKKQKNHWEALQQRRNWSRPCSNYFEGGGRRQRFDNYWF